MDASRVLKTLGNKRRLEILAWLADPEAHFPPQRDGDLVDDGVCLVFIADKAGISQPSASGHPPCSAKLNGYPRSPSFGALGRKPARRQIGHPRCVDQHRTPRQNIVVRAAGAAHRTALMRVIERSAK